MTSFLSVLILAGDPMAKIIKKGLEELELDIKTEFFLSGKKALPVIEKGDYDLVIASYRTGDLSGTELVRAVKEKNKDLPFLIIADPADEHKILKDLFSGPEFGLLSSARPDQTARKIRDKILFLRDQKSKQNRIQNSERIIRNIFDSADYIGIITTDENKIITYFSKGAEKLLGYRHEELVGKETPEIFHLQEELTKRAGDFSEKTGKSIEGIEIFAEKMAEGVPERNEWTYRKKDGSLLNVELTVTPIRDDAGNVLGAFGIFYDITDKKRLEEEFESYKIQSSGIIAHIPEPTFAIDLEGKAIAWNQAIEKMTGIPASDILGKNDFEYAIPFYGKRRPMLINLITATDEELRKWEYSGMSKTGNVISSEAAPFESGGRRYYIKVNASPIYDNSGKIIGAIESISDVTSLKETENALRESEAKFRGVAERSSDIIMFTDTEGVTTYISPSAMKILGYNPEDMEGKGPEAFIKPEDLKKAFKGVKDSKSGKVIEGMEIQLKKKDGSIAILDISGTPIIENGAYKGIQIIARDITERKEAQKRIISLLNQQKVLLDIINRSPVVAFLWRAEENWPVDKVSENISQFGYTTDDFTSGRVIFSSIIHPDDLERVASEVEYNSENNIDEFIQTYRILGKDKKEYWIEDFTRIRRNEKGEITHYQGIILDITDRKKAEDELKESSAILRGVVESPKEVVIFALDREYRYLAFNENHRRTMKNIWGIDIAIGKSMLDYVKSPEDRGKAKNNFDRALAGESFTLIEEYGNTALKRLWYENLYNPILNEKGDVIGLTVFLTDITARKRMEEEIKESEVRFRELFNSMHSGVAIYEAVDEGEDFVFLDFNHGAEIIENIKKEDVIGRQVTEVFPGVREFGLLQVLKRVWQTGKPEQYPTSLYQDERITSWRENYIYRLPSGEIVAIYDDVTEAKKAEEALVTEKAKTENVIDSLPGLFYIFSETGKLIRWNKNFETLTGYSAEEIKDMEAIDFIDEKSREQVSDAIKTAFSEGYAEVEGSLAAKDGRIVPIFFSAYRKVLDNVPYLLGTGLDITTAKEAEAEIRKLASIVQHSGEFIALTDTGGRGAFINQAGADMIGIDAKDFSQYQARDLLPDSLKGKLESEIFPALLEYDLWEGDLQLKNSKTAKLTDVHATAFTVRDPETGEPLFFANISLDITARKRAEKALAREKANVEYIIDSLPGMFYMFYMFDSTGKFVRWNKNLETLTGYSEEEVKEMRPLEFIEDSYKEKISEGIKTAFSEGYADLEAVIVTKTGEEIPFFFSANRKVIDGTPYILGMGLDITKAKMTEEEIRKLAAVVKHSGEMIALTSPEGIINFMNEAGAKMVGSDMNNTLGHHFMDFIPDHMKEKMNSEVLPTMINKGLWEGDLQYLNKTTGDFVDVHAMIFTINDPETGAMAYLANVSLNISDRKKAEAALKEVNKKLNLLGSITRHDILNQITVAQGYLDILEMDGLIPEDSKTEEFYRKILGAVDTIKRQILFTKDYKDLGEQSPEWYNAGKIIDHNYRNASFQSLKLVNEADDLEVYADPLFEKVIYNLFDNAVKHGEKITTIKFYFKKSGDSIDLICEDDGVGIPVDVKDKIFRREYYKHTGLGLFLSKEILSITGLSIEENGKPGEGARFVIHIPKGLFRFPE